MGKTWPAHAAGPPGSATVNHQWSKLQGWTGSGVAVRTWSGTGMGEPSSQGSPQEFGLALSGEGAGVESCAR